MVSLTALNFFINLFFAILFHGSIDRHILFIKRLREGGMKDFPSEDLPLLHHGDLKELSHARFHHASIIALFCVFSRL